MVSCFILLNRIEYLEEKDWGGGGGCLTSTTVFSQYGCKTIDSLCCHLIIRLGTKIISYKYVLDELHKIKIILSKEFA